MPRMMDRPVVRQVEYAELPWIAHPIDIVYAPQGWGPFNGAWTPWDWIDPADAIADTYGHGESNQWEFAPPYQILTLYDDHSLDYEDASYGVVVEQKFADEKKAYTSTIANVTRRRSSMLSTLRSALGNGDRDG